MSKNQVSNLFLSNGMVVRVARFSQLFGQTKTIRCCTTSVVSTGGILTVVNVSFPEWLPQPSTITIRSPFWLHFRAL